MVPGNAYGVPLFFREVSISVALVVPIEKASKKVIFQFRDESLSKVYSDTHSGNIQGTQLNHIL
jgi:hypothetical protein